MTTEPLLRVSGLAKHYRVKNGLFARQRLMRAVDGIGFEIARGETLAIVGESGCGKSTTARMVSGLLDPTGGSITLDGRNIVGLRGREAFELRRKVQMVFQDPMASLNGRMKVGAILEEPLIIHAHGDRDARRARVQELLRLVGLRPEHADRYPHQFSGGQKQRIGIARALAVEPRLLVLDEPVSALDVSVQAQIINLLKDLQAELGLTYLFIAHDLAVVKHMADRVAVMYLGRVVEEAEKAALFEAPRHPYTRMLLSAVPRVGNVAGAGSRQVVGEMPSPVNPPSGCHFHPRCRFAAQTCRENVPLLGEFPAGSAGGRVACHLAAQLPAWRDDAKPFQLTPAAGRRMEQYRKRMRASPA